MAPPSSPREAAPAARRTSLWQLVLVALALGVFSLFVLLPVNVLLLLALTGQGVLTTAGKLEQGGVLVPGIFEEAMTLALVLVALGLGMSLLVMGWGWLRRLDNERYKLPWLIRSPWFFFGALLALAWSFSEPSVGAKAALPVWYGGLMLALNAWFALALGVLLVRLSNAGLELALRIARASPFWAGMLTVGGVGTTVFFLLALFGLTAQAIEEQRKVLPQPRLTHACDRASAECIRQSLVLSAEREEDATQVRPGFGLDAEASTDRIQASQALDEYATNTSESARGLRVNACLETHYQDRALLDEAQSLASRIAGTADAWDLVHATLLSVCMHDKDYVDFRQFFLRSIRNGAFKRRENGWMRMCSLDELPESDCGIRPDEDVLRSETVRTLRDSLCLLSEGEQEVLRLRYFEERDELAIADQLGISYAATRKRIQRAREHLADEFLQRCR